MFPPLNYVGSYCTSALFCVIPSTFTKLIQINTQNLKNIYLENEESFCEIQSFFFFLSTEHADLLWASCNIQSAKLLLINKLNGVKFKNTAMNILLPRNLAVEQICCWK